MTVQPTGEIHPAAEAYRLFTEEELAELAADIKTNGQLYPIVLDADGAIVDGRNRLAACRLAGVLPQFTRLNALTRLGGGTTEDAVRAGMLI